MVLRLELCVGYGAVLLPCTGTLTLTLSWASALYRHPDSDPELGFHLAQELEDWPASVEVSVHHVDTHLREGVALWRTGQLGRNEASAEACRARLWEGRGLGRGERVRDRLVDSGRRIEGHNPGLNLGQG